MALPVWVSNTTNVPGTTSVAPTLPASVANGDGVLIMVACKPDTATIVTPTGWTLVANVAGGGGTAGNGTGPSQQAWFFREYQSAVWTTMPTITITGGTRSQALSIRYTKTAGTVWDVAAATGTYSTASAAAVASPTLGSNPGLAPNDAVVVGFSQQTLVANEFSAESVSATGVSAWGTVTERLEFGVTTNPGIGAMYFTGSVTTGTATANPVVNATLATAGRGTVALVRLRELNTVTASESNSLAVSESSSVVNVVGGQSTGTWTNGVTDAFTSAGTFDLRSTDTGSGTWYIGPNYSHNPTGGFGTFAVSGGKLVNTVDDFNNYISMDHPDFGTAGRRVSFDYVMGSTSSRIDAFGFSTIGISGSDGGSVYVGGALAYDFIGTSGNFFAEWLANGNYVVKINNVTVATGTLAVGTVWDSTYYNMFWLQPGASTSIDNFSMQYLGPGGDATGGQTHALSVSESTNITDPTAGTPISGSESNSLAVSAVVTVAGSSTSTESNSLAVAETVSINKQTTESNSLAAADASTLNATSTRTESNSLAAADVSAVVISTVVSASESNSLSIADARSLAGSSTSTESNSLAAADVSSTVAGSSTSTESNSLSIADVSSVVIVTFVTATESNSLAVAETRTIAMPLAASESNSIAASDVSVSSSTLAGSESNSLAIAEASTLTGKTATESNSLAVAETSSVNSGSSPAGNESVAISIADVSALLKTIPTTESNSLSIADVASITQPTTGTESNSLAVSEASSAFSAFTRTESNSLAAADSSAVNSGSSPSGAETNSLAVSEVSSFATVAFTRTESNSLSIADVSSLLILVPKSGTQSYAISVAESSSVNTTIVADEESDLFVTKPGPVLIDVTKTDSPNIAVTKTINSVNVTKADASSINVTKTDAAAVVVTKTIPTADVVKNPSPDITVVED